MTRLYRLLRYPSFVLVILAILIAIPGAPETRSTRLALFSLVGLAVGELLLTGLLLARGAPGSSTSAHLVLAGGALMTGLSSVVAQSWASPIGMGLMLLGVILVSRYSPKSDAEREGRQ